MTIKISSSAFKEGELIPPRYTCDDVNVSPPLEWDFTGQAKSFVLICDDPDAPSGTWTHWLLFNIPSQTRGLSERVMGREEMDDGSKHGQNGWGNMGYSGPCPPKGFHRYFFRIYALNQMLDLKAGCTRQQLLEAMQGHIIDEDKLVGIYFRV